jgi:arylsulfatase A-like enzyme
MRGGRGLRGVASLLLGAASLSCGRDSQGEGPVAPPTRAAPPSIALLVVDTLRRDHLGAYGYERATTPGIDRWSTRGLVFDSAYTPVPFTAPAVMSLLTGLYPEHHRVRMVFQRIPPQSLTLPQYLKQAGYHTAAVVSNMVLTDEATGLGGRFDYFDDYVDEPVRWSGTRERPAFERTAERTTDAALAWLGKAKALGRPLFIWVHYMDPHGPYTPPAQPFRHDKPVPMDPKRVPLYNRTPGVTDGAEVVDRYDGEIAHTDRAVARFIEAWERAVAPGRSVVVLTADHGETLMEPGREQWFTHGFNVWQEQARVPLVLAGDGIPPGRRTEPVSLLDVVPTLLEVAGRRGAPGLDGRSLLGAPDAGRELLIEGMGRTRGNQFRALVKGSQKWVLYSEGGVEHPASRRLFDLEKDPQEQRPAPWPGPAATAGPPTLLAAFRNDPDPSGLPAKDSLLVGRRLTDAKAQPDEGLPVVSPDVDPETLERLRALGYVQ